MTMPTPEDVSGQGNETISVQGSETESSINPAWNEALSLIPQSLHNQITPVFQKWDQGVQAKIEEYNTKYSGFDPFVQNGVTPEIMASALHLAESLQNDPRGVYDAIASHYKFEQQVQQAIEDTKEDLENTDPNSEKFAQLEERLAIMANILLNERQEKAATQAQLDADAEFDAALKEVAKKYGEAYNEDELLTIMQQTGMTDPMVAMDTIAKLRGGSVSNGPTPAPYAPNVMGSGGNIPLAPQGNKHPSQLSEDETVDIVATMLRGINAQKRGQ